jgi:hypothetical protein
VLRGLIEGIDDFIEREPPVHSPHHETGAAMLGSAIRGGWALVSGEV